MKKLFSILLVTLLLVTLAACSSKTTEDVAVEETVVEENADVTGMWVQEHGDTDDYYFLTFNEDGSGSVLNADKWIGVPFTYEVSVDDITTHMGSVDDNTPMTYDVDKDVIVYDNANYTKVDASLAKIVDTWVTEANEAGEYYELIVEPDATGYNLNMPLGIGLPLRFDLKDDGSIDVEEASPEFVSPLTYDETTDTILLDNLTYTRAQ